MMAENEILDVDLDSSPEIIFEDLGKLGEGSYGRVVKVRHRQSGNIYAIK